MKARSEIFDKKEGRKSNLLHSKKGAEMTIGTIVIIVLAIIVLIVVVLGFVTGWGNFWSRIVGFFGGSNVDSTVQACQVACAAGSQNDFCEMKRIVTLENGEKLGPKSCHDLLSRNDPQIKIKECSIECPLTSSGRI